MNSKYNFNLESSIEGEEKTNDSFSQIGQEVS